MTERVRVKIQKLLLALDLKLYLKKCACNVRTICEEEERERELKRRDSFGKPRIKQGIKESNTKGKKEVNEGCVLYIP